VNYKVNTLTNSGQQSNHESLLGTADSNTDTEEDTIWQEKGELIKNDKGHMMGGNINQLLNHLTNLADNAFIKTFLTMMNSFTTPRVLFEKLKTRFAGPPDKSMDEKELLRIRLRICVVLNLWVENHFSDFYPLLLAEFEMFIDSFTKLGQQMTEASKKLNKTLAKKKLEMPKIPKDLFEPFCMPVTKSHFVQIFMDVPEDIIARQFTLIEFDVFMRVKDKELLDQSWTKPKLRYRSPNVTSLIERANVVSFWVATMILSGLKGNDRAQILTKFIRIGQQLEMMGNFNTLIAIIAGINLSAINRLKFTLSKLDKSVAIALKRLEENFIPQNSFRNYRGVFTVAQSKGPVMPYLGISLTDLVFTEDGNPNSLQGNEELINFQKRNLVCEIINDLKMSQDQHYTFQPDGLIHPMLLAISPLDDNELYALSLEKEPRGMEIEQLEHMEQQENDITKATKSGEITPLRTSSPKKDKKDEKSQDDGILRSSHKKPLSFFG